MNIFVDWVLEPIVSVLRIQYLQISQFQATIALYSIAHHNFCSIYKCFMF